MPINLIFWCELTSPPRTCRNSPNQPGCTDTVHTLDSYGSHVRSVHNDVHRIPVYKHSHQDAEKVSQMSHINREAANEVRYLPWERALIISNAHVANRASEVTITCSTCILSKIEHLYLLWAGLRLSQMSPMQKVARTCNAKVHLGDSSQPYIFHSWILRYCARKFTSWLMRYILIDSLIDPGTTPQVHATWSKKGESKNLCHKNSISASFSGTLNCYKCGWSKEGVPRPLEKKIVQSPCNPHIFHHPRTLLQELLTICCCPVLHHRRKSPHGWNTDILGKNRYRSITGDFPFWQITIIYNYNLIQRCSTKKTVPRWIIPREKEC